MALTGSSSIRAWHSAWATSPGLAARLLRPRPGERLPRPQPISCHTHCSLPSAWQRSSASARLVTWSLRGYATGRTGRQPPASAGQGCMDSAWTGGQAIPVAPARHSLTLKAQVANPLPPPGPRGGGAMLSRDRLAVAAGLVAPLALAAVLAPFRASFANTDAALAMILIIVAVAAAGNRLAGYVAAISAAAWFDFFLTRPYEQFAINRAADIETT